MRQASLLVLLCLAGCASDIEPPPLYTPSEPLPVRVSLRLGQTGRTQLYGPGVLTAWTEMGIFSELRRSSDTRAPVDARLRLSLLSADDDASLGIIVVLSRLERLREGDEIFRSDATLLDLPADTVLQRLDRARVTAQARAIANAAARELDRERDSVVAAIRSVEEPRADP